MAKRIFVNHLGYMTDMPKSAVCRVTAGVFYIVDAVTGMNVYAGRLTCPFFDRESGDTVRLADFSDFNDCGSYFIRAGYRRSDIFEISDAPYKNVRKTVLDGIYAHRCGFDLTSDKKRCRNYAHKECHHEPVMYGDIPADVSGGWHCGGGYDKTMLSSCLTAADMIYALRLFGDSFSAEERGLIADECVWGLEWLLKMQDTDGGVFDRVLPDKILRCPPEEDAAGYTLDGKSCRSALIFTAVTALGAEQLSPSDPELSHRLRSAAEKSWLSVLGTEEYGSYSGRLGAASEGGEGFSPLESEFMWAMCELYSLTGESSFRDTINEKYLHSSFAGFGYSSCGGFAALSYLMTDRRHDRQTEAFIRKRLTDKADRMCLRAKSSGYGTARNGDGGYAFGSNFAVLSDCMDFITAYLISGEQKYLEGATNQLSYIFGRNPMGIAYMTGCGGDCCERPCHCVSALSDSGYPLAGMIVAGANEERSDDYSKWNIKKGTPAAKCYADHTYSVSTNEPWIHFSAPVIFVSAFYDKVGRSALSGRVRPAATSRHK